MMRRWLCAVGLALALGGQAFAGAEFSCLEDPLDRSTALKRDLHEGIADLVAATAPEHERLARLAAELQVIYSEQRKAKVAYLLRADPGRVPDAEALRGFGWGAEDEAVLAAENPAYALLSQRRIEVEAESEAHPGWPALRAIMRERLAETPEYKALLQEAGTRSGAVLADTAACFTG